MKDYRKLIENIQSRTNPENIILEKAFSDELSSISYSDILKYVRYAMKGVEPEYTQKSRLAGERVQNHLKDKLSEVEFKYQGSVMTNTHIKGTSDIDLLVICDKFYTFDRKSINAVFTTENLKSQLDYTQIKKLQREIDNAGYSGNVLDDLKNNRKDSETTLIPVYDICDISHPKAIKITNKSLNRDVDIVIANWYDNVTAVLRDKDSDYRGIQVYNKETNSKGDPDYPFLSIKRINDRSTETNGRLKRMIRFLKNIKADSDLEIKLSSFDINAICYDLETYKYSSKSFYELVPIIYLQLKSLSENTEHSNNLKSVDGNEFIFRYDSSKLNSLRNLMSEIDSILLDLKKAVVI
ncbi:MAG: nucleotidyltransferase domain-containing protein [Bacteroidota bacterium]